MRELLRDILANLAECCLDELTDEPADDGMPDDNDDDDDTAAVPPFDSDIADVDEIFPDFCFIPGMTCDLLWSFVRAGDVVRPLFEGLTFEDLNVKPFGDREVATLEMPSESDAFGEII